MAGLPALQPGVQGEGGGYLSRDKPVTAEAPRHPRHPFSIHKCTAIVNRRINVLTLFYFSFS